MFIKPIKVFKFIIESCSVCPLYHRFKNKYMSLKINVNIQTRYVYKTSEMFQIDILYIYILKQNILIK